MSLPLDINEDSVIGKIQSGIGIKGNKLSKSDKELINLQVERSLLLKTQQQKYVEDLLQSNSNKSVKIANIQILGTNDQFRSSFINQQLKPILQNNTGNTNLSHQNLQSFLQNLDKVNTNFISSQAVKEFQCYLETFPADPIDNSINNPFYNLSNPNTNINIPNDTLNIVPVFKIIPSNRFFAKTGTTIGDGEGNGYINFQFKNIFKGCENLSFDATAGTRTKSSYLINFNTPILNKINFKSENLFFSNQRTIDWCSNHLQSLKGFSNKFLYNHSDSLNFEFSIENSLRSISVSNTAQHFLNSSNYLIKNSGDNFKSSIAFNVNYDKRNDFILPTNGFYFKYQFEFANNLLRNLLSNKYQKNSKLFSHFIKNQFETQFAYKFNSNLFLNFNFKSGYLHNLNTNHDPFLMDNFNLGGPTDIRGFNFNGIGPLSTKFNSNSPIINNSSSVDFLNVDRIGANFYYSSGISLFTTIPRFAPTLDSSFKFHTFLNFGKLISIKNIAKHSNQFFQLIRQPNVSTGFGIVFKHPSARLELNFVLPLAANQSDSIRKGLQYGIGLSFL
ncbi:SAM complex subunit SAM50 ASCRUDRAFT_76213 [Ascoidea rubescens DSM 1968]|uniref:Bacterial surface antigen (D15) domain-containing protein n=1 Tax=Ascoidea rubescens DSM 1968 TaxID=1344418 RepID=A0A1D2VH22_9ASCO|nr:hypothetical protein ASCRUDRAFT_76213 [Ascoidea rubescens DSM 1968]ODV60850.1 hypothetical protein ASCRUDRAFT_76213 [Ascoidea rubescens DSM 1968]